MVKQEVIGELSRTARKQREQDKADERMTRELEEIFCIICGDLIRGEEENETNHPMKKEITLTKEE